MTRSVYIESPHFCPSPRAANLGRGAGTKSAFVILDKVRDSRGRITSSDVRSLITVALWQLLRLRPFAHQARVNRNKPEKQTILEDQRTIRVHKTLVPLPYSFRSRKGVACRRGTAEPDPLGYSQFAANSVTNPYAVRTFSPPIQKL